MIEYYSLTAKETIRKLETSPEYGLTSRQAKKRLEKYGNNTLTEGREKNMWQRFIEQFSDFMVIVLLIASFVSFITSLVQHHNDYIDSVIILVIVLVNAAMGVIQEFKAEKALASLKKLSAPKACVIRMGQEMLIDSDKLVPGDIMLVSAGDFVAADARLVDAHNLKVEESALTGESIPVIKEEAKVYKPRTTVAEQRNMLFASSNVISGRATAIVVHTGMYTQVGKIARLIDEGTSPKTPLQKRLSQTGKILGISAICICFVIFILGSMQGVPILDMFMIAISLAVAAIPEGLPAVVTIVLSIGVRRMAIKRAIIRKLPAVETLGSASVICSDKTGTLTQNKMSVTSIASIDGTVDSDSPTGKHILMLSVLCNNFSKDPTESALVMAAEKAGYNKKSLDRENPRIHEISFDSFRKRMTTVHKLESGQLRVITKGAPDVLIQLCNRNVHDGVEKPFSKHAISLVNRENKKMAEQALRVIAVAYKDIDSLTSSESLESDLVFCGLIGMMDLPREGVKHAVKECLQAGIKPVMITGDHIDTAQTLATQLGILSPGQKSMSGECLQSMSQAKLEKEIFNYSVFARVTPEHKVRIVKAFQKRRAVVAMTGDGVNDAPALKIADIGCAMGVTGTDVAKNAADMILTDDNFSTIVTAVKEGRSIYENIKKTIKFLLSSNTGEIITVLVAFLLRMPSPLLAIQLLWVNLVTDSLPALALGVEPAERDVMKHTPINRDASFFSAQMGYDIVVEGCFIGVISILSFAIGRAFFDIDIARTMAFAVLSLSQIVHAFNVRSERSVFEIGLFSNVKMVYSFIICVLLQVAVISVPLLSVAFKTHSLTFCQWLIVIGLSLSPLAIVEAEKRVKLFLKGRLTKA